MASAKNTPKLNLVRAPFKNELIDHTQLNDQQKQAINHRGSPLLVLGEAGSGKTTTLISAVGKRISEGQDPNSILVIPFIKLSLIFTVVPIAVPSETMVTSLIIHLVQK